MIAKNTFEQLKVKMTCKTFLATNTVYNGKRADLQIQISFDFGNMSKKHVETIK